MPALGLLPASSPCPQPCAAAPPAPQPQLPAPAQPAPAAPMQDDLAHQVQGPGIPQMGVPPLHAEELEEPAPDLAPAIEVPDVIPEPLAQVPDMQTHPGRPRRENAGKAPNRFIPGTAHAATAATSKRKGRRSKARRVRRKASLQTGGGEEPAVASAAQIVPLKPAIRSQPADDGGESAVKRRTVCFANPISEVYVCTGLGPAGAPDASSTEILERGPRTIASAVSRR